MFDHVVEADSVLWPLLVLVSIWFFAFMGAFLGVLIGRERQSDQQPPVPVLGDVRTIIERR